jgi:hypothetical protein
MAIIPHSIELQIALGASFMLAVFMAVFRFISVCFKNIFHASRAIRSVGMIPSPSVLRAANITNDTYPTIDVALATYRSSCGSAGIDIATEDCPTTRIYSPLLHKPTINACLP